MIRRKLMKLLGIGGATAVAAPGSVMGSKLLEEKGAADLAHVADTANGLTFPYTPATVEALSLDAWGDHYKWEFLAESGAVQIGDTLWLQLDGNNRKVRVTSAEISFDGPVKYEAVECVPRDIEGDWVDW